MTKVGFFPKKTSIKDIIKDGDLDLEGYKIVNTDIDFTGITEDFDFQGRSVKNIDKLTADDYFGAYLATASANVQYITDYTAAKTLSQSEYALYEYVLVPGTELIVPAVYAVGSKINLTAKVSADDPVGGGFTYIHLFKNGVDIGVFHNLAGGSSISEQEYQVSNFAVHSGDVLDVRAMIYTSTPPRSVSVHELKVTCDNENLNISDSVNWSLWQV